jgi:putative transposase
MARLPRLALAGELHHLGLLGHNGAPVFVDSSDREAYLGMARQAALEQGVAVHAYALLDAEVQMLVTPARDDSLGRMMQSLGRRYVAAFNRRHGRRGTLWDGRFRSSVLEAAAWLFDATVFIETLAVVQGLAAQPGDWPWSSAAHHLGRARQALVSEHELYWQLGNTPFERELAHAHMLATGLAAERAHVLRMALRRGHALGGGAFLAGLAAPPSRPLTARPRGRPKLA